MTDKIFSTDLVDALTKIDRIAPGLPIVVLSADSDVVDKVLLLEMGARDYITKPFSPRELLARLRAALRSAAPFNTADIFVFDDVTMNFSKREATHESPFSFARR